MYRVRWDDGGRGFGGRFRSETEFRSDFDQRQKRQHQQQMRQLQRTRLELEGNRKLLGKGKIFTAMKDKTDNGEQKMMSRQELTNLLASSGLKPEQVVSIKFNEFRRGQVEFLLNDGVQIDIDTMEKVVTDKDMKMTLGLFDHEEEVMMIYGLPLTKEIEMMKEKIEESIMPFVKTIISVVPCTYAEGGNFFRGKYNGTWRVVVEPKRETGVPNFIVVDSVAKVQGQVNYVKSFHVRPEMCADCYKEGHLKRQDECEGARPWLEYCREFQEKWSFGISNAGISKFEEMSRELKKYKEISSSLQDKLTEVERLKENEVDKEEEIKKLKEDILRFK